ncbi:hypothetical protein EDF68_10331 [Ochrobactrum sp. BH3]|nr:hypothetical protein EDF68_10331 [Ochrobactrum sp. BH3]
MNLAEFKAWLEGYSASFKEGAPSQEQWAIISKKLGGVIAPFATQPAISKLPPIGEPWLDRQTVPKVWYETKIISDDRPMMQSWNSAVLHG